LFLILQNTILQIGILNLNSRQEYLQVALSLRGALEMDDPPVGPDYIRSFPDAQAGRISHSPSPL
jgi:hypothetical protein